MGILLDLAKALTGEKSLHGTFGRWIQAVSRALDEGAAAPDYAQMKITGAGQAAIGANTNLALDTACVVRGDITHQPATGTLILPAGKTFLLQAQGYFSGFSDATGGALEVQWVDGNNVALSNAGCSGGVGRFVPTTNTTAGSSAGGVPSLIYTVPDNASAAGRAVRLRAVAGTGTADMPGNSWVATATEIPG